MRTLALPSDPPDLSPEYIARTARDQQKVLQECRAPEPVPAAPAEAPAKIAANPMRLYRVHGEVFTCFMTKPNEIPEDATIIDIADPDPNYRNATQFHGLIDAPWNLSFFAPPTASSSFPTAAFYLLGWTLLREKAIFCGRPVIEVCV